uniref:Uncharacterized protein n=1 Tax=Varanus komodoensis TaxID=61221 RepID=A0A8D2LMB7_VARKO
MASPFFNSREKCYQLFPNLKKKESQTLQSFPGKRGGNEVSEKAFREISAPWYAAGPEEAPTGNVPCQSLDFSHSNHILRAFLPPKGGPPPDGVVHTMGRRA